MRDLAKEFKRIFGDKGKEIRIKLLYQKEVNRYVGEIEEAHKKAAKSRLTFP